MENGTQAGTTATAAPAANAPASAPAAAPSATAVAAVVPAQAPAVEGQPAAPAAAAPVAPEKYEFKLPEGVKLEADELSEIEAIAKEGKLSQEAAQKLVDSRVKANQKVLDGHKAALEKQLADTRASWRTASESDPELQGESIAQAQRGMSAYASPELVKLLGETKFGDHPLVIKHFKALGALVKEDVVVPGSPQGQGKSLAEKMYPNHKP